MMLFLDYPFTEGTPIKCIGYYILFFRNTPQHCCGDILTQNSISSTDWLFKKSGGILAKPYQPYPSTLALVNL